MFTKNNLSFPILCMNTIQLQSALANGVHAGRSFFPFPPNPNALPDLGDFYSLWIGIFQSTVLGRVPYINVDVAHKAFPTPLKLVQIVDGMYKNSRNARGDIHSALNRFIAEDLARHLRGLRILYEVPGQSASKKSYKFALLGQTPDKEMFNHDGKNISVATYFQSKQVRLQFPNLPCVKVGNEIRRISLPMEFCSIPPGQVRFSYILL